MPALYPLKVFYDGACGVCSSEMSYYRSIADKKVVFIDIAAQDFCPETFGRQEEDFQRELHVCDAEGRFATGVEGFRLLWEALPSPFYPLLSKFVGLPGIHLAAVAGYSVFARFRHLLPGSKSCSLPRY
jgi:predicted DCC family thiol-disulfide oxidoreductase YuxK